MGDGSTAAPAAEPVAPSSIQLQGGLKEFSNDPPAAPKQCKPIKLIKMTPTLDLSGSPPKKAGATKSRRRLQGGTQRTGNPNVKLVPQTATPAPTQPHTGQVSGGPPLQGGTQSTGHPGVNLVPQTATPAPTQPQTGHATGGPPLQATIYDPNNPHLGDWVPPELRNRIPPGEVLSPDGRLYPIEASQPDWQDDLFVAGFFGSWLVNLFRAPVVPLLPRPVVTPNQPAVEEQVWVSITKEGQIIWRQGETWFGKTANGYYETLSNALKNGARPKLPGYYRAGGR